MYRVIALLAMAAVSCMAQDQISEPHCTPSYVVAPTYPRLASQARFSGTVTVDVSIASSGVVDSLTQFEGDNIFRKSSQEAAIAWKFQRNSGQKRSCKLTFVFTMMPTGTRPEDLTTRFSPPGLVEVTNETVEPTVLVDPAPDSPRRK